ncbi:hypothetical protein [Ottowia sp. VDI28]|uniref:hypothetical protein n=1 Tax=Ottowia sp. VDI28 TaxID=3133968 RepID=UPI003C302725
MRHIARLISVRVATRSTVKYASLWMLTASLMCGTHSAGAFNIKCSLGAKCVESQGASIPSEQVLEMMEYCDDFTRGGVGRTMLRLSLHEILQSSAGNHLHPIYSAYYAFEQLRDSPLAFKRRPNVEDTDYNEIAKSCAHLSADFEKWVR